MRQARKRNVKIDQDKQMLETITIYLIEVKGFSKKGFFKKDIRVLFHVLSFSYGQNKQLSFHFLIFS